MTVETLSRDQSLARDKRQNNKLTFCNFLPTPDNILHVLVMKRPAGLFWGENMLDASLMGFLKFQKAFQLQWSLASLLSISTASELGTW